MGFSVQLSTSVNGKVRKYPHDLKGQQGTAKGVDSWAAYQLRDAQRKNGEIVLTKKAAKALALSLTDGGRISAYEKPVFYAAVMAAKGADVKVTDATGHWRTLTATEAGKTALFAGLKGTHIAKVA